MDEYLKNFGITPADVGLEHYLKTASDRRKDDEYVKTHQKAHMDNDTSCNGKFGQTKLNNLPLAMSYTPCQFLGSVYAKDEALKSGTLFPELDKPFLGRKI